MAPMDGMLREADAEADEGAASYGGAIGRAGRSNGAEAGNVAEELGPEAGTAGGEGTEADAAGDHEVVAGGGTAGAGRGGAAGAGESVEAAEASEGGTRFEEVEGWSPDDRFRREAAESGEATVDAYFADGRTEDSPEFFAALLPVLGAVVKTALPSLVGSAARAGSAALQARLRQHLARLGRRESGQEGAEADLEALERALEQFVSVQEVVIGPDDRRRVTATNALPWKRICHLSIRAADGGRFLGTGFFVGPRTVATAGHCVFLHGRGGWASEIEVSPGRDAASRPNGMVRATAFRSVRGWVEGRKRDCDYGVIQLPRSFHAPAIGAFGFAALPDAQLRGVTLNTAGHPGDKPAGTMWYHGRQAKAVSARVITYDIDTAGGQSGSAVWLRRGDQRLVVGIHTNGSPGGNSATRITKPVFDNLVSWRREGA